MESEIGRKRIIISTNLDAEEGSRLARSFTKLTRRSRGKVVARSQEREPNRSLKAKYHRLPAISFELLSGIWLETGGIRSRAFSKLAKLPMRIGFSSCAITKFAWFPAPIRKHTDRTNLFLFFFFFSFLSSLLPLYILSSSLVTSFVRITRWSLKFPWFAETGWRLV